MNVLFTGGARSGKSDHAQQVAEQLGDRRLFIATAEALDDEMRDRIARHRAARGEGWQTVEAPIDPASAIVSCGEVDVILLDCVTLWVSNVLHTETGRSHAPLPHSRPHQEMDFDLELTRLTDGIRTASVPVLVVTNEVGLGVVPADPLSRRYRDLLGTANAALAQVCDSVILMVAGLPIAVKGKLP